MNTIILILLLMFWLTTISIIATPYWTRKTESFGVTIPKQFFNSPELKQLRKQYILTIGIITILFTASFLYLSWNQNEFVVGMLFSIILLSFLAISFVCYVVFHFKMKKIKQHAPWTENVSQALIVSTSFRQEKLNYSNFWFLISMIPAIIMIFFTLYNYDAVPNEIPLQFNFAGEVTSSVEKSPSSSLILPIMQIVLTIMFAFFNTMISKAKQQIDSNQPEQSLKRNALFRRRWSLYLIVTGNTISFLFLFIQLTLFFPIDTQIMSFVALGISIFLIVGAIFLSFQTGQGGSRLNRETAANDSERMNRDDDEHWKLGIFYFNKEDPALFLEKRFGVGWTINLARPLTWVLFLGIIGLSLFIPYILS